MRVGPLSDNPTLVPLEQGPLGGEGDSLDDCLAAFSPALVLHIYCAEEKESFGRGEARRVSAEFEMTKIIQRSIEQTCFFDSLVWYRASLKGMSWVAGIEHESYARG